MRIAKVSLNRRWLASTMLALAAYAVLATLDLRLKALSGVGTFDLQSFTLGTQFDAAFHAWGVHAYLSRAGFNLGFDYLFMPLCAVALFYSGVIVVEAFAPPASLLRRLLSMAALAPLVAGVLDAIENALHLTMLWGGASDSLAQTAHAVSTAKMVGFTIGLVLLLGAILARVMERQKARLQRG